MRFFNHPPQEAASVCSAAAFRKERILEFSSSGGSDMQSKQKWTEFVTTFVVLLGALIPATSPVFAANKVKVLHNFNNNGSGGFYPLAGLIFDKAGNLYGTTSFANGSGCGTMCGNVFELTPAADGEWLEKVLYTFCSLSGCADGLTPLAGVTFDAAGNIYGTTEAGGSGTGCGAGGCGTVFELTLLADGTWAEKVLHNFSNNATDGYSPQAAVTFDSDGNLYGTTPWGGRSGCNYSGCGTVFELSPGTGGTWTETILHRFNPHGKGGLNSYGGVILDAAKKVYGTTFRGGTYGHGTVYELSHRADGVWTEKVLHSFGKGKDGRGPTNKLIFDSAGNLYSTTYGGGASGRGCGGIGCGTVFELTPATDGTWGEKVLHSFFANGKDGIYPNAGLIFAATGDLYGTANSGGAYDGGVVFRLTPATNGNWKETALLDFNFYAKYGAYPESGLILNSIGNLYGAASQGGAYGYGTVFEVIP
jgi:uncharacterized repeat protein (TIGR03803 family)